MTRKTPKRKRRFRTLQPRPPIKKLPKRRLNRKSRRPKKMLKLRSKKQKKMLLRLPKIRLLMHLCKRRLLRLSQLQNQSRKLR